MTTLFASSNPIKLEEARQVFLDLEALELDAPEIQDTNPLAVVRGELGGWTLIFEVEGTGKTLDEMDLAERMTVTMRGRPLQEARTWLAARKEGVALCPLP